MSIWILAARARSRSDSTDLRMAIEKDRLCTISPSVRSRIYAPCMAILSGGIWHPHERPATISKRSFGPDDTNGFSHGRESPVMCEPALPLCLLPRSLVASAAKDAIPTTSATKFDAQTTLRCDSCTCTCTSRSAGSTKMSP